MNRLAFLLLALIYGWPAFSQSVVNPANPTSNPNQVNVTTSWLYLNKMSYAGAWSSGSTYNIQDVVFVSNAAYISLQTANVSHSPASSPSWWALVPSGGLSPTIFGYLGNITSDVQTQLNAKQASLGFTPLNPANNLSEVTPATARTNLGITIPVGAIVGTTDTQVLTNKSITGAQITSAVPTATALATAPTKCSAGNYALGIDVNGNAQSCTAAGGTANWTTSGSTFWSFGNSLLYANLSTNTTALANTAQCATITINSDAGTATRATYYTATGPASSKGVLAVVYSAAGAIVQQGRLVGPSGSNVETITLPSTVLAAYSNYYVCIVTEDAAMTFKSVLNDTSAALASGAAGMYNEGVTPMLFTAPVTSSGTAGTYAVSGTLGAKTPTGNVPHVKLAP